MSGKAKPVFEKPPYGFSVRHSCDGCGEDMPDRPDEVLCAKCKKKLKGNPPVEWGVFTWNQPGRYPRTAAVRTYKREGDAQRFADRENAKDMRKNLVVRPLWPAGNPGGAAKKSNPPMKYKHCGLNADWISIAIHRGPGAEPNRHSGDYYAVEDEDSGGWLVVQRFYEEHGGNDTRDEIISEHATVDEAVAAADKLVAKAGRGMKGAKKNPPRPKIGRGIHLVIGRPLMYSDLHEILDGLSRERKTRPLRAPHHTVGMAGMFGETRGEWWLAEGGMLYMQEAADFLPAVLRKVFELFQSGQGGPAVVVMHVNELGAGETRRFERTNAFSHFDNVFEHGMDGGR